MGSYCIRKYMDWYFKNPLTDININPESTIVDDNNTFQIENQCLLNLQAVVGMQV